jgi:hypothetical protein
MKEVKMKEVMKILAVCLLSLLLPAFCVGLYIYEEHKETERQRLIVNEVRPLIEDCKQLGEKPISIRGTCLVWDITKNFRANAHGLLPRKLRATSSDNEITVFMVLPQREELVGHYSVSKQPGYRQYVDVCVVYWPQKKAVGMHSVISKDPPLVRKVTHSPEYGDPSKPIASWIESLPGAD